ncbi:ScbA/BarX family gamma-butyrolactone biosynthesis protein [Streptomyces sp. NPDC006645]|uniref:ScbA/BarX family gamma-butyrolactone biosynthesis protein n=1 Tax=unclassified Streptomyces TaxID=2593676 RepID=UPI0033ADDC3C
MATTAGSTIEPRPTSAVLLKYTRKTVREEMLLEDWRHLAGTTHTVNSRWPDTHSFYTSGPDSYNPLIFAETIRQALSLLSHTAHDIPLSHRLSWEYFHTSLAPAALRGDPEGAAVELTVTHTEPVRRRLGSTHLTAHIAATRDGEPLGAAKVHYTAHPPAIYDRLRGTYANALEATSRALPPGAPLSPPTTVGCLRPADVLLSPTELTRRWRLRADTSHPVLFDHPHDHMPGMVLLGASAQALRGLVDSGPAVITGLDAGFKRYTELDEPCWIEASPLTRVRPGVVSTEVSARQHDRTVFTCLVSAHVPRQ